MNAFLQTLRNLGPARLGAMVAVGAGVLAFFIYLSSRLASPDMALLYGDLESQDSSQIVSRLGQLDVPFTIGPNGSQIFVPQSEVGRLRLAMAEEGLPAGGSIGYEIFDRSEGLGTSNFVQNINHLRALEGELSRTIQSIGDVKNARVHLVLPRRELFSRERQEPSASIIVTMNGNRRLDRQQIAAVQHLVAAAVPGLKANGISIVDNQGSLLARGGEDGEEATASNAEEMRISYENRVTRTIEELLERSVGPGNVRAEVRADMDFDRVTENAEIYDPDGQVVRSTQTVEEFENNKDSQGADAVTAGNNLPDANLQGLGESGSTSQAARTEETVNYEISKTIRTHVRETGLVRRMSVAVLVNGSYGPDGTGEMVYSPRSAEELEQLASLVRSAVGYDETRGDSIEVVNMQFFDLEQEMLNSASALYFGLSQTEIMRLVELVVLGLIAILALLFVVRPLVSRMLAEPGTPGLSEEAGLLPDPSGSHPMLSGPEFAMAGGGALGGPGYGEAGAAGGPGAVGRSGEMTAGGGSITDELEQMIDLSRVEGQVRASSMKKIGDIVQQQPEEAVAILRAWIYQES